LIIFQDLTQKPAVSAAIEKGTTPTAVFLRCKGCQILASFDGGDVTSDGGILLLRQMDR
jgi:hypothetical protein